MLRGTERDACDAPTMCLPGLLAKGGPHLGERQSYMYAHQGACAALLAALHQAAPQAAGQLHKWALCLPSLHPAADGPASAAHKHAVRQGVSHLQVESDRGAEDGPVHLLVHPAGCRGWCLVSCQYSLHAGPVTLGNWKASGPCWWRCVGSWTRPRKCTHLCSMSAPLAAGPAATSPPCRARCSS